VSESKDKTLTYIKVLVPVILALLASDGWQYLKTPDKIEQVVTGSKVIAIHDSVKIKEQATAVVNQIMDNKLSELIITQGIKDKYSLTDEQSSKLDGFIHKLIDPDFDPEELQKLVEENKLFLESLRGVGIKTDKGLEYIEPNGEYSKVFYSKSETVRGKNWKNDQYWRLNPTGKMDALGDWKNIITKK
jgi:hypothetical protein